MNSNTTKKEPITPRQRLVFDFICECLDGEGLPPTFDEIKDHMGYRSTNAAVEMVDKLKAKGWVRLIAGKSRGIIPTTATIKSGNCRNFQMTA